MHTHNRQSIERQTSITYRAYARSVTRPKVTTLHTRKMVAVETVGIKGSGRGLVAVTPIAAGELVLRESPVILTVTQDLHQAVCALCLRYINGKLLARTS